MQVGDPKKTAFLAIIAVLAIGFCFKQLTGGGSEPKVLRQAPGGAADPAGGAQPQAQGTLVAMQLDELRVDPFSHPKLAPKTADNQLGAQPTTPNPAQAGGTGGGTGLTGGGDEGTHAFQLPPPFGNGSGAGIDKTTPDVWPKPVNPGQKPDAPAVKLTQITLKAIVKVGQRQAYLSIDGQDARGFRAGDVIKNDIQVAFVNDDSVIVKTGTKTVTLKVGQQGDL
jgi:hypothetical protein